MSHEHYMRRCLDLARLAGGEVAPNPMVGALLLYQDRIIGAGFHRRYGGAHAEIDCLESVSPEDRHLVTQSTLYVPLEPCAHHGNTPPCAIRVVQEGIRKVVISNSDPFEKVNGQGIHYLRDHGVEVIPEICSNEGRWLNRRFFHFHERKRPYIILKWAATADGYIAPPDRRRYAITNTESQRLVHKWRTEEAAIMVGYRTAVHDNPRLTARLWEGRQPLRIVTDRQLQLPATHHLFNDDAPTWIINELKSSESGSLRYLQLPSNESQLPQLLQALYYHKTQSLFVEGGATLLQRFIVEGLWDEARIFTSEHTLGAGIPAPALAHGTIAKKIQIADDRLEVYTNKDNSFIYSDRLGL